MPISLEGRRRRRRGVHIDKSRRRDGRRRQFSVGLRRRPRGRYDERIGARHFAAAAGAAAVSKEGAQPLSTFSRGARRFAFDARRAPHRHPPSAGGRLCATREVTRPLEFASRLNSMKDRRDLAEGFDNDPWAGFEGRRRVDGLTMVVSTSRNTCQPFECGGRQAALDEGRNLKCGAVCLRYPTSKFGEAR